MLVEIFARLTRPPLRLQLPHDFRPPLGLSTEPVTRQADEALAAGGIRDARHAHRAVPLDPG